MAEGSTTHSVDNSEKEQMSNLSERPKSDVSGKQMKRQVSFQLGQHGTELDNKQTGHVEKPVIRQCSFQLKRHGNEKRTSHDSTPTDIGKLNKKKSLTDLLPELMRQFKTELGCKSFIQNTRKAIERKKTIELDKPKERQWMRGNDLHAFYHTWQISDDHIKDQSVRPRTVRRYNSLPRDFKMTQSAKADSRKPSKTAISEFGIVRECCSRPRMRVPTFLNQEALDHHVHASAKK